MNIVYPPNLFVLYVSFALLFTFFLTVYALLAHVPMTM